MKWSYFKSGQLSGYKSSNEKVIRDKFVKDDLVESQIENNHKERLVHRDRKKIARKRKIDYTQI